nr:uncharacterized protein LOC127303450 [Lolium perenne]
MQECGKGHLKGKKRAEVRIILVKTTKKDEDEGLVGDGLADVAEGVGEGLQLGAVVADGEIPLWGVAEVGLQLNGVVLLVVAEEVLNGVPDDARRGARAHDDAEEVDGDGAIYPGEDGVVVAAPGEFGPVTEGVLLPMTWAVRPFIAPPGPKSRPPSSRPPAQILPHLLPRWPAQIPPTFFLGGSLIPPPASFPGRRSPPPAPGKTEAPIPALESHLHRRRELHTTQAPPPVKLPARRRPSSQLARRPSPGRSEVGAKTVEPRLLFLSRGSSPKSSELPVRIRRRIEPGARGAQGHSRFVAVLVESRRSSDVGAHWLPLREFTSKMRNSENVWRS